MKIKSLTIYCSSSNNLDSIFYETGKKITEIIAELNYSIVYGGGQVGLMGIVAKKALDLGVNVTGIIPEFLNTKEIMFEEVTSLKVVKEMSQRKKLLFDLGDAFIALPGGTGTIEEIAEIISWKVLGLHNKPILFYNINDYWNPLLKQFKLIDEKKFGNINLQTIFQTIDTPEQFKEKLKSWKK
tara:strand:+ start:1311 stop:1862 length:552 start_codon:yes stop_codon:yes gene_type:complete